MTNGVKTVRTRFAPSPTGYIHVGNVRSAIYPWLLARQANGILIIRIEDTDQERFVEGATELILDTLKWLGIDWDEGPEVGGPHTPYFQSERKDIYKKWGQKLVDKGLAYADPYTAQEIEAMREAAKKYNKPFIYRHNRPDDPPSWDGTQALRFKAPDKTHYEWHDAVMGDLSANEMVDDFILIKSDGLPTYNFGHIVDDTEMQITHAIRGVEYIASIPKYLALYEALGIKPPVFACLPHIMRPDGKKKLGKRDGAKSVAEYRNDGILPEAMFNFLATLGWNDGSTQEIFTVDELIEKFSLGRVQRSGARFDEKRLLWMNGQWIRRITLDDLFNRVKDFWGKGGKTAKPEYKKAVLNLAQDRLKTLKDLPHVTEFFFTEPTPNWSMIDENKQLSKLDRDKQVDILQTALDMIGKLDDFSAESVQNCLNDFLTKVNQKPVIGFSLIRFALTWTQFSPDLHRSISILGKETTIKRLQRAIDSAK
ncbi:MAG: glutamate--tRNA ligase [Candidatus Nanosyncoccaceae bacterium]|jgi:glutamyl-tRNA synthetase